jgi:hypothetical protein
MSHFGANTFREAAAVLADWSAALRRNLDRLRTGRKLTPGNDIERPNMKRLRAVLNDDVHKIHCLIGDIEKPGKGTLSFMHKNYALNSDLVYIQAYAFLPEEKFTAAVLQDLKDRHDRSFSLTMYLRESLLHLANIADQPEANEFVALYSTGRGQDGPASKKLKSMIEDYKVCFGNVSREVLDTVLNRKAMPQIYYNPIPWWLEETDEVGARVVNEVWFPGRYAQPLLAHLAAEQAAEQADALARRSRDGALE